MRLEAIDSKAPLDERYFHWLYNKAAPSRETDPNKTYWELFYILHRTPFEWFIPNDDNRSADGTDLRYEYLGGEPANDAWLDEDCSMLEMLIGLARRLSFEIDEPTDVSLWYLLSNLGIDRSFNDTREGLRKVGQVNDILETVILRTYDYDGTGGLFPLIEPHQDQRTVEIWYQMSAYLTENQTLY